MKSIQVDMFEVQLGAGMLLQFTATDDSVVRVLADAGVHASGYDDDHVHSKLPEALRHFRAEAPARLDLIIGTHYDADHLTGLVPIIEDEGIEIGEIWLPPVANDALRNDLHGAPQEDDFLANQFAGDGGERFFAGYINAKARVCEELARRERELDERRGERFVALRREVAAPFLDQEVWGALEPRNTKASRSFFQAHIADACCTLEETGFEHADEAMEPLADVVAESPLYFPQNIDFEALDRFIGPQAEDRAELGRFASRAGADSSARVLAALRRSSARDAINATSLQEVVTAAKRRGLKIRCQVIDDGEPRHFVWKASKRRFVEGVRLQADGPAFDLLGPSQSLVKKHWHRLPIGTYAFTALARAIPIRSITPSNQLSYIARFEQDRQGILITGDAGCVDFKRSRSEYFDDLLQKMTPLHVIQVAHHGGNNAHFYRVLLEAGYAQQDDHSWLLLSHATDDRYRPSDTFERFVGQVRTEGDDVKLLFTSRPKKQKVEDYKDIIEACTGAPSDKGDVRMSFGAGAWHVDAHAIKV